MQVAGATPRAQYLSANLRLVCAFATGHGVENQADTHEAPLALGGELILEDGNAVERGKAR